MWNQLLHNLIFMRSVNRVVLIGYLPADPETKSLQNGQSLVKFKVATHRDWKGRDGDKQQVTDFHKVVAWNALAQICGEYLKKGSAVYLEGRLMNGQYEDKAGIKKSSTEIVADIVNFINYRKNKDGEQINLVEVPA